MGNMRRLPDGQDFSAEHFAQEKDFGFSGSAQGYDEHPASPPFAASKPTDNGAHPPGYADGGPVGGSAHTMAHGGHMHPHGHHVDHVEHHPHTGAMIVHHKHGGHSVHHPDGHISHHDRMGRPVHHAMGGHHGEEGHDGTHVGKLMASRHAEPDGDEGMARGGHASAGHAPRIPRSMRPKAEMEHSPINTPPRNPTRSVTPRNEAPGGQAPYGVEPSSEPDVAGDGQGISQLAKGGRHHKARGGAC